jgi:hypothetical protein
MFCGRGALAGSTLTLAGGRANGSGCPMIHRARGK